MLIESLMILLGCSIATAIIVPAAVLFDKWKKEMGEEWKE